MSRYKYKDLLLRAVGSAFITVLCRLQVCLGNVQVQGFILREHGLGPLRNLHGTVVASSCARPYREG